MVNLCLKSYQFCLYFILNLHVWIRIRIVNTDPNLQHCCKPLFSNAVHWWPDIYLQKISSGVPIKMLFSAMGEGCFTT